MAVCETALRGQLETCPWFLLYFAYASFPFADANMHPLL